MLDSCNAWYPSRIANNNQQQSISCQAILSRAIHLEEAVQYYQDHAIGIIEAGKKVLRALEPSWLSAKHMNSGVNNALIP